MPKSVLVIGGTRFFGRLLVRRLLAEGHAVTLATRGLAADDFGTAVERARVDRRDREAMMAALAGRRFDLVYDQMCYSPLDAAISAEVFGGSVGRYVMTSTLEVYDHVRETILRPFIETDVDLTRELIDHGYPWHDPSLAEASYASGKRQAEAFFARDGRLPLVAVRVGHVLSGLDDFTGRLADYVGRVEAGRPLLHSPGQGRSSFIDPTGIVNFLLWTGQQDFEGPVNAASDGVLSAGDIYRRVAALADRPALEQPFVDQAKPSELSPFDFPRDYVMSTDRAVSMGFTFGHTEQWLDGLIAEHLTARAEV